MFPMSRDKVPAPWRLDPPGGDVALTGPLGFPVASVPDVLVAIPEPIAWRPHIAGAWRRNGLDMDGRWRPANDDIDGDLLPGDDRYSRADD